MHFVFIVVLSLLCAACAPITAGEIENRLLTDQHTEGLTAYWPMDGPSDRDVVDLLGRSQGRLAETVVGNDSALPYGRDQSRTISLWFAPSRLDGAAVLFAYGRTTASQAAGLWLPAADRIALFHWVRPDLDVKLDQPIKLNKWHHVVGVYDAHAGFMRLYYDGRLVGSKAGRPDTAPGGRFLLGRNLDGRQSYSGRLDELAVFSRALSEDDVAWLYNAGAGRSLYREGIGNVTEHIKAGEPTDIFSTLSKAPRCPGKVGPGALRFGPVMSGSLNDSKRAKLADWLGFDRIIFAVRQADTDGHWYANFGYDVVDENRKYYHDGGAMMLFDVRTGHIHTLLDAPQGSVRDPQLHYSGKKVLFSFRKGGQPYYHLYEMNLDGSELKQLTHGPYDDFEPTYLPDGGIAFCSSRCMRWVPCYITQVAIMYRCDSEGGNIQQLSANTEQENTPWVLPDGKILYQRWEYVDRSQVGYHHLWTMNPDGTNQMVYYGNLNPDTVMLDAKPIPNSRKIVASFSPGHGRTEHAGFVTILDASNGPDDRQMAQRLHARASFRDPYPLSETLFLVARNSELLLMDDTGRVAGLCELPEQYRYGRMMLHEPRPVQSRPRERIIASNTRANQETGSVILSDVYRGRNMKGVAPGDIKRLLVLEILPKPANIFSGMEPLSYGGTFLLERIIGTVPVEQDGSAYMELPAMRPLFFVALDSNGMAVKRMQSFLTLQRGETVSCVGCHEHRTQTPPNPGEPLMALAHAPARIEPVVGIPEVIDFPRDVQPILDRHCVRCHGYDARPHSEGPMAGGIILTGDRGPMYSHSYYMLTIAAQFVDGRNLRKSNYQPRSIGSSASPMMEKLDGQHHEVKLSPHEKQVLRLWIDTGAVYAGTYAALGTGSLGDFGHHANRASRPDLAWQSTQRARKVLTKRCAKCHKRDLPDSPSDNKGRVGWAEGWINALATGQSQRMNPAFRYNRHLLYNLSRPEKSLLLLAPLCRSAGGYGLCTAGAQEAGQAIAVFSSTADPDYQTLLQSIHDGKRYLEQIKRFDMAGFQPRSEYLRELRRYGLIPPTHEGPYDVYQLERHYWDWVNQRSLYAQDTSQR